MEASLGFYRDLLGLKLVDDAVLDGDEISHFFSVADASIRAVLLAVDGSRPYLELFEFFSPEAKPSEADQTAAGLQSTHPCFLVSDIHTEYQRLQEAGVRFTRPPLRIDEGPFEGQWILYGFDPDGAIVEFWSESETGD
jgi:catechol 2,3-dioxygenase-like lactoylglutathione lyase family enzyme